MTRFAGCIGLAIVVCAAVLSPRFDALADASFAWHMAQHLVLLFVVPFLILAAAPFRAFAAVAPKRAVSDVVRWTRPLHLLANPAFTMAFFIGTLWMTHFSGLYEFALQHEWAHVGEHLLYLTAGLLFWTPVLAPPPVRPLPFPARIAYLLFALPQAALLAFALDSARHVLYAHYAAYPGALADQQNAAAVMWIAGGLIVFTAFLSTIGAWALRESAEHREPLPGGMP